MQTQSPRVRITCDVEKGGAVEKREIPFVVGIFADLSGRPQEGLLPVNDPKMVEINRDNFDAVMAAALPTVKLDEIPNVLPGGSGNLTGALTFSSMDQFGPLEIVKKVPNMLALHDEGSRLRESLAETGASPPARLTEIHEALGKQLNLILHAANFQKLEATWRGLNWLATRTETGELLKLRVLDITQWELLNDLRTADTIEQSRIFKLICSGTDDPRGRDPYSMLVGDYAFGRDPQDIELLGKLSEIAAAAHAPFISSAHPYLFGLTSFTRLGMPRDLDKIFESSGLVGWRLFRQREDSRYVTLTLPPVLMRLPYGANTVEGIQFVEEATPLWGNSAFILAQRVTHAYSLHGWTAAICGEHGGGLVEGLPTYAFETADDAIDMLGPTQVVITDRREKELQELGFTALCRCKGTNKAVFYGVQTTCQPRKFDSPSIARNAQLSTTLPHVLAASRFAHYIQLILREKACTLPLLDLKQFLNEWLAQYVQLDDDPTPDRQATYPLREASVNVTDVPGRPGVYRAVLFVGPRFQLEEPTPSLRLIVETLA